MKTFQHQVSYEQDEDQQMIKEGLEFNEIPSHIDVLPIFTKEKKVTFIYSNEEFEMWGWGLTHDNHQLIIDNYIKKFPKTKDFEFDFLTTYRFGFFNL